MDLDSLKELCTTVLKDVRIHPDSNYLRSYLSLEQEVKQLFISSEEEISQQRQEL